MKTRTLSNDLERGESENFYRAPDDKLMKLLKILNQKENLPYDLFFNGILQGANHKKKQEFL